MAIVFALPRLFDAVVTRFAAEAVLVPNVFGWREPAKRPGTSHRIVWVPGDDESGELGEIVEAKQPGRNPRPLATLEELFTVYIEARDDAAAENERAQYIATRTLFDSWYRAVYLAAHGTIRIESAAWVISKKERRAGAAIRVLCTIEAAIVDAEDGIAPTETGAEIATSEYTVTETTVIKAPARAATTAAIALSGLQTIDGVDLADGDRVLVRAQAAGETNGIYTAAAGAWTRTLDADTSGEVPSGLLVAVQLGATQHGSEWVLTTPAPIVLGTTPLTFARLQT
jgi:hypothetical protein